MCPLGMYGQESKWVDMNPVRKRYLRFHKDFAVDSVKYPIWEYQNSVIFANSGVTLQFKKGGPFFYTDQSPLHKGEYNVSGVIAPLWNGHVYGMGRQMNLIGIGVFNYAAIGYNKSLSDNLFADVALHAMKLSTPRHVDETFGISGKLSYSFNSRMSLHVFGGFLFTPVTSFSRNDYGGSVAFDITDSFGTEFQKIENLIIRTNTLRFIDNFSLAFHADSNSGAYQYWRKYNNSSSCKENIECAFPHRKTECIQHFTMCFAELF